ncbi:odorant receptor 42a-like isoform X1 [Eupeodes corollae]|uniref:odorant receptor 42a-like isoform X1 n=1 Tax=Eupeodes corollae TaxID=290404 RepID=UPI00249251B6|nr:odorant receptor 42a-like isoform X1 [Eupeodes corollae]
MVMKLDTTVAFSSVWRYWSFFGIHPFAINKNLYILYSVFINIAVTLLAPLQLIVQGFFVESFAELMRNMSTSFELAACSLQMWVLLIYRKNLLKSHQYLKELDNRVEEDPVGRMYMEQVVRNCQRLFIVYLVLFWSTVGTYGISAALAGRLMLEGWLPFDWRSSRTLYVVAFGYQLFDSCVQCMMNLTTDIYSVFYIYVILGHIQCLAKRISNIGHDNGAKTTEENYCELIRCVNDHRNTLDYFYTLSPVVSATIFIQFVVAAFVLCITALCFCIFDDLSFKVTSFCYLTSILIEVLPCCYLVSEIMEASTNLTTAVYSCNWMDQDVKFRKAVIIFMQHTQKPNSITAGNMIPISLPTFMGLIRLSFSIFTLLSSF